MGSATWTGNASNVWQDVNNWSPNNTYPQTTSDTATLNKDITGTTALYTDVAIVVGTIVCSDNGARGFAWSIETPGAATLTVGTVNTITDLSTSMKLAGTGTLTKTGAADFYIGYGSSNSGAWNINQGRVYLQTVGTSGGGTITVNSGATFYHDATVSKPVVVASGGTLESYADLGSVTVNVGGTAILGAPGFTATALNGTITVDAGGYSANSACAIGNQAGNTLVRIGSGSGIGGGYNVTVGSAVGAQVAVYNDGGLTVGSSTYDFIFCAANNATTWAYYRGYAGSLIGNSLPGGNFMGGTTSTAGGNVCMDFDGGDLRPGLQATSWGNGNVSDFSYNFNSGTQNVGASTLGTNASSGARQQAFSVTGGTLNVSSLNMAATTTDASAGTSLNVLSGGTASIGAITMTNGTNKRINMQGGTLTLSAAPTNGSIYLYGTNSTLNFGTMTLATPLLNPVGNGITAITFTGGGTGYIGAPVIKITGIGSGATARAIVDDYQAKITSIQITSPGINYSSTPTLSFIGGGTGAVAPTGVTITRTAAVPGGFLKSDGGTLTLTGANTFTGTVSLSGGVLDIGGGGGTGTFGASNGAHANITNGAVLRLNRTGTSTYSGNLSGSSTATVEQALANSIAILSGSSSSYAGKITVAASAEVYGDAVNALGNGSASIIVNSGGTLSLRYGTTSNKPITLTGTGVSGVGAVRGVSGDNVLSGTVTFGGATTIAGTAGTLSFTNTGSTTGAYAITFSPAASSSVSFYPTMAAGAYTVTKTAAGTTTLKSPTNAFSSTVTVSGGTLEFARLANAGTVSSLGTGASAAAIVVSATGTTLRHFGGYSSITDRPITISAATTGTITLDASGTTAGALVFNGAFTSSGAGAKTLALTGSNAYNNTVSTALTNLAFATSGALTLTKSGNGTWVLSSSGNTYTGGTTVSAGTLVADSSDGQTRFGAGDVMVAANAKVHTLTGTSQNGKHRYAANLTFSANGRLRIGGTVNRVDVYMTGALTINGATTWDLSKEPRYRANGTYTLFEFAPGVTAPTQATLNTHVVPNIIPPPGKTVILTSVAENTAAGTPARITVTVS